MVLEERAEFLLIDRERLFGRPQRHDVARLRENADEFDRRSAPETHSIRSESIDAVFMTERCSRSDLFRRRAPSERRSSTRSRSLGDRGDREMTFRANSSADIAGEQPRRIVGGNDGTARVVQTDRVGRILKKRGNGLAQSVRCPSLEEPMDSFAESSRMTPDADRRVRRRTWRASPLPEADAQRWPRIWRKRRAAEYCSKTRSGGISRGRQRLRRLRAPGIYRGRERRRAAAAGAWKRPARRKLSGPRRGAALGWLSFFPEHGPRPGDSPLAAPDRCGSRGRTLAKRSPDGPGRRQNFWERLARRRLRDTHAVRDDAAARGIAFAPHYVVVALEPESPRAEAIPASHAARARSRIVPATDTEIGVVERGTRAVDSSYPQRGRSTPTTRVRPRRFCRKRREAKAGVACFRRRRFNGSNARRSTRRRRRGSGPRDHPPHLRTEHASRRTRTSASIRCCSKARP